MLSYNIIMQKESLTIHKLGTYRKYSENTLIQTFQNEKNQTIV